MPKTWVVSDESVNSYGFVVGTAGIILSDFIKNPVMLLNHNMDKVMGNWLNPRIEGVQLRADDNFDLIDPEALLISGKVDRELIKGCSMGIKPLKVGRTKVDGKEVPIVLSCLLKEVSVTPLPSNKNSVRIYDENDQLLSEADSLTYLSSKSKTTIPKPKNKMKKLHQALLVLFAQLNLTSVKLSDTEDEEIFAAEVTLAFKNTIALKDQEITTLTGELATFKKSRVDSAVTVALSDRKFVKADEPKWRKRLEDNYDMAMDALSAIPAVKSINGSLNKLNEGNTDAAAGKREDRSKWDLFDWSKNDQAGLLKLKADQPDLYKALLDGNNEEAERLASAE